MTSRRTSQSGIRVKTIGLVLCISIIIISTKSFGQSTTEGIKLGFNSATVGGATNYISLQSIPAFNAGVFINFNIASLLSLQPELLYTNKGYKLTHKADDGPGPLAQPNYFVTANNSYLEIPVLLKLYPPSSAFGIVKPNIFMGPEVAFELNGSVKYASTTSQLLVQDQGPQILKPTDIGIVFGIGADINLPTAMLMFDVRYDLGVKGLNFPWNSSNIRNKVLTIDAGIGINCHRLTSRSS